ncbi:MAG: gliding motility-associated C-terminal domain-containing protein [Maribacter sp.]|uniref:gliding motility-associated C-terminal domain-containing protein n=1 Tax=Maribacter sp. TaxID=1897614 RepID=UPI00329933E2
MKNPLFILACLIAVTANAQTALYNSGNMQIHDQGQLGFHIDLINDGSFDENLGLAGFYGDLPLTVSGAFPATFFDLEISNPDNVVLNTSLNTSNNTNFVLGNFITPRAQTDIYLNFLQNATSNGSGDIAKINGYAAISNKQNFTFPVGDASQLRQLVLNSDAVNVFAKCAYFLEDPNSPSTFPTGFDTNTKVPSLGTISTTEFWHVEGNVPSTIQITWNTRSNIAAIVTDVTMLDIVGWRKSSNQWVSIGTNGAIGDLTQGFVRSASFIPDDYAVITFGNSLGEPTELINPDNFLVTPNGDGVNDVLVIPETDLSPNNSIQIFDRYGLKVFEMNNYTNEFNGFATTNNFVIAKDKGLPSGVYFYILSLHDIELDFQGFLYLAR